MNRPMKKVLTEDGKDITEAVQILYDIAHGSMDWGSGFLDNEEMEAVVDLAVELDFPTLPGLPSNSPVWVEFIKKYPEHYELIEREVPASGRYPAYTSRYIRQKEKSE